MEQAIVLSSLFLPRIEYITESMAMPPENTETELWGWGFGAGFSGFDECFISLLFCVRSL